jgi:hypothetical protein
MKKRRLSERDVIATAAASTVIGRDNQPTEMLALN